MMETDIVYEGDQHGAFLEELAGTPEGEHLLSCIQCGTCGGTCPVAPALEHTPRRLIAMIRAGMKEAVLGSLTPWVCASCYDCTVKCPAQIKITELMYSLKRRGLREGLTPAGADAVAFYNLFTDLVRKYGRAHEMELMTRFMAFRHPVKMALQGPMGLQLMMKGRMPLMPHRLRDYAGFSRMVEKALALENGSAS